MICCSFGFGNNRNAGVGQLLRNSRVEFRDICALKEEENEEVKDMKVMLKELPVMIENLPMDHSMKAIITTEFENEIRDCRNTVVVEHFYNSVQEILTDISLEAQIDNETREQPDEQTVDEPRNSSAEDMLIDV